MTVRVLVWAAMVLCAVAGEFIVVALWVADPPPFLAALLLIAAALALPYLVYETWRSGE